ncbi:MAG: AIR synthase-related protein [Pseudonocardiaceae bacterium]
MEPEVEHLRRTLGLPDLEVWHDYYIEFEHGLSEDDRAALGAALGDPIGTIVTVDQPLQSHTIMVSHRRGIVDNENGSIVTMCALLGIRAQAGKLAINYRSLSPRLREVIEANRFNNSIEELHETEPHYKTLRPAGMYLSTERHNLSSMDDAALTSLGKARGRNLSLLQMRHIRWIQETLGHSSTTDVLLEALDARWSDHCAHTTWKSLGDLLDRLVRASRDTGNPNIVSMFHDNAGVWEFYEGYALAIKAETHNGPSAISAYFGQLTKLGGVLRDILGTGLGADPIGCFEYTATGLPEAAAPIRGRPGARQIALETIRAIKEYGNTFGVPMMWSHMTFHPSYRAKPFALGGSIGILPMTAAQRGQPVNGDFVVLIGGLTGNEGIHGASASSAGSTMDEAAVQIGAPLEQVKFREALLDLRDAGCLRALTDIGGAGLNSAVGEIGQGSGIWINTALVPLKTSALPMWRILLSESQERMLLAVPPEMATPTRRILERHQVRNTVIGRFTDNGRYCVFHQPSLTEQEVITLAPGVVPADHGELGFDVPYALLDVQIPRRNIGPILSTGSTTPVWPVLETSNVLGLLERVVADAEVASQHYADAQYDSTVQGNTVHGPRYGQRSPVTAGYWACAPVHGTAIAAVVSAAFNAWLFEAHPVRALRQMFCGLIAGQVLAGVNLHDICVCDNFYTPHLAEHWKEWLVAMVDELAMLVRHFEVPIISGKDSSAGSTHTDEGVVSVPPAVFLTALGKVSHYDRLLGEEWTKPSSLLVQIGPRTPTITGTVAARTLGISDGIPDDISLDEMDRYLRARAANRHLFRSGTRLGPGGLVTQVILGSLASGLGVDLVHSLGDAEALFAEHRCGALVEIDEGDLAALPQELRPATVGRLNSNEGVRLAETELLTPVVRERWATSFVRRLE